MPSVDQNFRIAVLSFAQRTAADGNPILIPGRLDLDPVWSETGRHQPIPDRFRPLQGKVSRGIAVTFAVGAADHHDGEFRSETEPTRLLLDNAARPPADGGAPFCEKDAVADVDEEGMAVFRRPLGFVCFQLRLIFRVKLSAIERPQRTFRT